METEVVTLVQRVLRHGIQLKERLVRGERFHLQNEQAVLKQLLMTEEDATHLPEYASETDGPGGEQGNGPKGQELISSV